jgi:hypothetical protein
MIWNKPGTNEEISRFKKVKWSEKAIPYYEPAVDY